MMHPPTPAEERAAERVQAIEAELSEQVDELMREERERLYGRDAFELLLDEPDIGISAIGILARLVSSYGDARTKNCLQAHAFIDRLHWEICGRLRARAHAAADAQDARERAEYQIEIE
jgi:hypothetical protein